MFPPVKAQNCASYVTKSLRMQLQGRPLRVLVVGAQVVHQWIGTEHEGSVRLPVSETDGPSTV